MKHLEQDLILDKDFALKLFLQWTESDTDYDYDYITWLKLLVMHRCVGGASNNNVELLKKTITVLIDEVSKNGK